MSDPSARSTVHVAAGVLLADDGRVLVSQRLPGKHEAGAWEFPGGKVLAGETAQNALIRELEEELGITVRSAKPLIRFTHAYADRDVELDVWRVLDYDGTPTGREGQAIRWSAPDVLLDLGLLDADRPIIDALSESASADD